ncbi:MAG: prolyl oligopeptidase family serine peptidase [Armatimonadota bacterium]
MWIIGESSGDAHAVQIDLPPTFGTAKVTLDGKSVPARQEKNLLAIELSAGTHVFAVSVKEEEGKVMPKPSKDLPIAGGEVFSVEGHTAFLVLPPQSIPGKAIPWVWYAPTLPGLPGAEEKWMFEKFLNAGIAIAGIDVGESYGNPAGRRLFSSLYRKLVVERGFSKQASLLARSRGGLMLLNWAAEHADVVACIAGIYPVCNISCYPGLPAACGAYGMTAEGLAAKLTEHNPIYRTESLARAGVPVFIIHGDQDGTVPLDKNSAILAQRYRQYGGEITLKVFEGRGHDMWTGWFQYQDLVDFIVAHATPPTVQPLRN